jgi:hypothetical protein
MWRYRAAAVAPALLLAVALTACTGDPPKGPQASASPSPTSTATTGAPTLRERAAPVQVRYRRVAGEVAKARRQQYLRALARPVRRWMDDGFVHGPWPREHRFAGAFVPFSRQIRDRARRDADLLTLQSVGASLAEVVPRRRRIAMSVTGVRGHVVGATARVDLRVFGVDDSGRRMRVNVRGDLFLTRVESRGWKIFGYQLDRWVEEGAMTRGGA